MEAIAFYILLFLSIANGMVFLHNLRVGKANVQNILTTAACIAILIFIMRG